MKITCIFVNKIGLPYVVRRVALQPTKLDKCITGLAIACRTVQDRSPEICCLKISDLGGLTKVRRIRDVQNESRIPVADEDTLRREIATAAVAFFVASTPEEFLVISADRMNYNACSTGLGGTWFENHRLFAPEASDLGVTPDYDCLGDPDAVYA